MAGPALAGIQGVLSWSLTGAITAVLAMTGWLVFVWPLAAGKLGWVQAHALEWQCVLGAIVGAILAVAGTGGPTSDWVSAGQHTLLSLRQVYVLAGAVGGAVSTLVLGRMRADEESVRT